MKTKELLMRRRAPAPAYRYIAMCDVLGFRALATNTSLSELSLRTTRLVSALALMRRLYSNLNPAGGARYDLVKAAVFSDTILLYSVELSPVEKLLHIGAVSCFFDVCSDIFRLGLRLGMPIRMGISFGETAFSPSKSIFVGQPIVWAHDVEAAQTWVGGACHESCEAAPFFSRVSGDWADVLPYSVPMRSKPVAKWALNWPKGASALTGQLLKTAAKTAPAAATSKYTLALTFFGWAQRRLSLDLRKKLKEYDSFSKS